MSPETVDVMGWMLRNLSSMKYGYKDVVEGAYDTAIMNVGLKKPPETKDEIVERVLHILNTN